MDIVPHLAQLHRLNPVVPTGVPPPNLNKLESLSLEALKQIEKSDLTREESDLLGKEISYLFEKHLPLNQENAQATPFLYALLCRIAALFLKALSYCFPSLRQEAKPPTDFQTYVERYGTLAKKATYFQVPKKKEIPSSLLEQLPSLFPAISDLDLSYNLDAPLKCQQILNLLKHYPNLTKLNLGYISMSPEELAQVSKLCPKLHTLVLTGFNPTANEQQYLASLTTNFQSLTTISFSYSTCSDNFLSSFFRSKPGLRAIDLSHSSGVTDDTLSSLVKKQGDSIRTLDLSGCPHLTLTGIEKIPSCPNLQELSLHGLNINAETINNILLHCPKITKLNLSQNLHLNKSFIQQNLLLDKLTKLNLAGCIYLDDEALGEIAESTPNLVALTLDQCKGLKNPFLTVAKNWPKLGKVSLQEAYPSEDNQSATIADLVQAHPRLTLLYLLHVKLTPHDWDAIAKNGKDLTHLQLYLSDKENDSLYVQNLAKHCPKLVYLQLTCARTVYSSDDIQKIRKLKQEFATHCPLFEALSVKLS